MYDVQYRLTIHRRDASGPWPLHRLSASLPYHLNMPHIMPPVPAHQLTPGCHAFPTTLVLPDLGSLTLHLDRASYYHDVVVFHEKVG